jgi:hypothetical protein
VRRLPLRAWLLLALAAAVALALATVVAVRDERVERRLTHVVRSLGFTGEDALADHFVRGRLAGARPLRPTVLQFGPDRRLYVAQQNGTIRVYTVARTGPSAYRVDATETIAVIARLPNHDDDGSAAPRVRGRQVTGMLVVGSAAQPVLYVSSSDPRVGGRDSGDTNLDTNSGVLSRVTRAGGVWRRHDLVRGLPRSEELHATNGLALSADGRTLYVAQGSNGNAGAPSHKFAGLPQYALSGAVLEVDLEAIGDDTYDLPTLRRTDEPFGGDDGRNQAVLDPRGPVRLYATGYRNPYDLVRTRSGRLYTVDNGMNAGWGGLPEGEGTPACTNAPRDGGGDEPDTLHLVERGGYAGNPNPTRANRTNRFDGRSPVPSARPEECDWRDPGRENGGLVTFDESTNGLTEYRGGGLGGELRGNLLTVSFDGSVYRIELSGDGRSAKRRLLFVDATPVPLDVVAQPDTGPFPGTIWIAGYATGEIVVYEPDDYGLGRWETRRPSGVRRQEVSYVAAGGKLYLAGGDTRHEVYDPGTDSWRDVAPLPTKVDHIQGVALGGRVYYLGGLLAWPEPAVAAVLAYDPQADRFELGTPMARPRGAGGVAAYDGRIYYVGGLSDGKAVPWTDVYDPAAGTWERLADMPHARDHFQAAVVGDELYAIGGRDVDIDATTDAVDVLDLRTGRWRSGLAPLPTPRGGFAVAVLGDEILVIGGEGGGRTFDTVEAYDTRTNRWRELAPMRVARHGISAAVCGGVYVAAGGREQGGGEPTDVHEVYYAGAAKPCR